MPLTHLASNGSSPVPLYHLAAQQLAAAIESGELQRGDFLASEIELAATWGVSRPTARRAIEELVDKGLVTRRRGVGTQVVDTRVRRPVRLSSLWDDLANAGLSPHTAVIALDQIRADDDVADALGLEPDTLVVRLERLRRAGDRPLALMHNWLPMEVGGSLCADDLQGRGLYDLLRAAGVQPHVAHQVVGAKAASPHEAEMLRLPTGAPLVTMRRVLQDVRGRLVEMGTHVYDAEHYAVEISLQATG